MNEKPNRTNERKFAVHQLEWHSESHREKKKKPCSWTLNPVPPRAGSLQEARLSVMQRGM